MPTYRTGDLWEHYDDERPMLCIPTNNVINSAGALVMGAGFAKQADDRWPALRYVAGGRIEKEPYPDYHLLVLPPHDMGWDNTLILFQTKRHWRDPSPLDLVIDSILVLDNFAQGRLRQDIYLPAPGIGHGGLELSKIKEYLDSLPDNVHVWTK